MVSQRLQLVFSVFASITIHLAQAQATAAATENGIVSAAGGPEATQSVSYSIMGGGNMMGATATISNTNNLTPVSTSSATDGTVIYNPDSNISNSMDHSLSVPAILGITVAVLLAIVGIILFAIIIQRRRKKALGRAKRKSIMDAEFAASKPQLQHFNREHTTFDGLRNGNIGYFDISKPLPAVAEEKQPPMRVEDDGLSRSSTVIADAAEIAQINRKASIHQARSKKSREQQRERNHALQILITNEDNNTTIMPLTSDPSMPVNVHPPPASAFCPDGDGNPFAKRRSKV